MDARFACLALAALPSLALASPDVSLPCSVNVTGKLIPAEYQSTPLRNPDGSFYPGDSFYYIFKFSASSTCLGLSVGPVVSGDGLDLISHESVTWQDAGRWRPGEVQPREADVSGARDHPHSDESHVPRLLETVHYYWREGGPYMFSVREDSDLQGWQKRALSGKAYWTESTWEWGYAAGGRPHMHPPPCETAREGECAAPDPLQDEGSRAKFAAAAAESCSLLYLYSGCVFGKARIVSAPGERCLAAELREMGVEDLPDERCVVMEQRVKLEATGIKKTCGIERGILVCRAVPVHRAAALTPTILEPDLGVLLRHERIIDSDGYLARNADGTYYVGDPVALHHEPVLKWKDERHRTVRFEVAVEAQLPLESRLWCEGPCSRVLERERTAPSVFEMGHGEGLSVYSAPDEASLGRAGFEYRVRAYNGGVLLGSASASGNAQIVAYDPVYSVRAYPALSDDGRTSYEDGVGVALHYFGSRDGVLHEGRRSKVDMFSYSGEARGPWEPVALRTKLEWSGARGADTPEHAQLAARLYPDAVPWEGDACEEGRHGTLMAVSAGYCVVYFSYPVLGEMSGPSGPRLEGALLRGELFSSDMGGKRTLLAAYEYRFAEPLFHSMLHVRAAGSDGSGVDADLRVDVEPAGKPLPEYVREKIARDTGDPGFADIAAGDVYPVSYSESGAGQLAAKLRRVSSFFPEYGGSADASGLGVKDLARAYLSSSTSARLAVPLDAGLGAPSPARVTVTADGISLHREYWPDFAQDLEIVVNTAQDNPLDAERRDGYVEASVPPWFGDAVAWRADGEQLDVECARRCVLPAEGRGSVTVEAENEWGGRARADVAGLALEPPAPPASVNLAALAPFLLILPVVWWVRERIRG